MNIPTWLKPAILGGIAGGIATMIVGFNLVGWQTESASERQALQTSRLAVVDALVPICLSQQKSDPNANAKLAQLSDMNTSYEQRDFVMSSGWATMPESAEPNRDVATLCAEALAKPQG